MGDKEEIVVRTVPEISQIPAEQWNQVAGSDNPFVRHEFLLALEDSGCATAETGWAPCHLAVEASDGSLLGAAPLYLKNNSYGEYVFDHGWAAAYERAGGHYYPKLQMSVPFTPVTGPRLLCRESADRDSVENALISAGQEVAQRFGASSLHVTFPTEGEWKRLSKLGLLCRMDQQFHWLNEGYNNFDDFLDQLSSRKRKAIRRERRDALSAGVEIHWFTGHDIREEHWDAFYAFYQDTSSRKWGRPYLNSKFFKRLGEVLPDNVALVLCRRDGQWIAGALNMIGGDALYGRYWGCLEDHRFLHFEVCYYQAIDFAISRGLKRVEAGAQGEHKLARGYLPTPTYSAHWIADEGFRAAVADFLEREQHMVAGDIDALTSFSPFKRSGS